jgi:hypothetical protein
MDQTSLILFVILIAFLYFMRRNDLLLQFQEPIDHNTLPSKIQDNIIPDSLIAGTHQINTNDFQISNGKLIVPESPYKLTCDESKDISCRIYNHRDINSKCTSLCQSHPQGPLLFNANHTAVGGIHTCECIPIVEHFTLDFSNITSNVQTLQDPLPSDNKYNDRNVLEQHEQDRLKNLIFG